MPMRTLCWLLPIFLIGCASNPVAPPPSLAHAYDEISAVEAFYGFPASQRVLAWRQLQHDNQTQPVLTRLKLANDFFNRLKFVDDLEHWGTDDYWATPIETIATNGGDCEDFALGKYFTLIGLGVPDQCLRMTYVKALSINQAHMVLSYQCNLDDETLILDNLVTTILPAQERADLVPVYSFNAHSLWLNEPDAKGKPIGNSTHLSRWQQLLKRVNEPLKP